MQTQTDTLVLNKLNNNAVKNLVQNWTSSSTLSVSEEQSSFTVDNNSTVSTIGTYEYNLLYPYPSMYVTYTYPGTDVTNKVLVTKAENGFVLVYNSKTYIARTEAIVAKLMVKILSNKGK